MAEFQISLAAARVNAEMTQEEAAKKIQVTKQTIVNWEKGRVIPRIPEMQMLSRIYNIPQDYIFLPSYSTKSRVKELENKELELIEELEQAMEQELTDESEEKYLPPDRKAVGV